MGKYIVKNKLVEDGKVVGRAYTLYRGIEAKNIEAAKRKAQASNREWARRTHNEAPKVVEVKRCKR